MIIGNKKNTKKRGFYLLLATAIVLLIAVFIWMTYQRANTVRDTNTVDYSVRNKEDQEQADEKKEEIIRNEKENAQTTQDISVVINRFLQIPSSAVQLRSTVSGTQSGECTATFTLDEQKFTKVFVSEYTGTYWACNLDLAAADFPASGTWIVSLVITSSENNSSKPATSEARIDTSR